MFYTNLDNPTSLTIQALQFLGQQIPQDWQDATQQQLLDWAIAHWQLSTIPKQNAVLTTNVR